MELIETTQKCDEKGKELARNKIKISNLKLGDWTKTYLPKTTEHVNKNMKAGNDKKDRAKIEWNTICKHHCWLRVKAKGHEVRGTQSAQRTFGICFSIKSSLEFNPIASIATRLYPLNHILIKITIF